MTPYEKARTHTVQVKDLGGSGQQVSVSKDNKQDNSATKQSKTNSRSRRRTK